MAGFNKKTYIPYLQVRSNAVLGYTIPDPPHNHKRHDLKRYSTYTGKVSSMVSQRIRRTVDVFLQLSPERTIWNTATNQQNQFRLAFCTLTIPNQKEVDGAEGYKGLKVFLDHFRKTPVKKAISEQLKSYIWKVELQERGQIHYHITTNSFLNLWEVRRVWNGICFRRGWMSERLAAGGDTNPNSTDIHAVYKVKDIQAYLGKYLSKRHRKDVSECGFQVPVFEPHINGRVWDASKDLKVPRFSIELDSDSYDRVNDGVRMGELRELNMDMCKVFCTDNPTAYLSEGAYKKYMEWRGR